MPVPSDPKKLAALFERLGASNPEDWAGSQSREGINQLHRYLFLRQAWSKVIPDGDFSWCKAEIAKSNEDPKAPYAGIGLALERLLSMGASESDLSEVVRGMQAYLLAEFCELLDDPALEEDPEIADLGWCLVETSPSFEATSVPIGCLHESVLETDPTGREMRPR